MPVEIVNALRHAVGLNIAGRGTQDPPHRRQRAGDKAGIGQFANADCHIKTVRDNVDEPVGQHQIDRQVRIGAHEGFQMWCNMHAAEGGRRGNFQQAACLLGASCNKCFGFLDPRQHGNNALMITLSCLGQAYLPGGALDKACSNAFFQSPQSFRNNGRRQAQLPPGRRQAAAGNHSGKDLKVIKFVHASNSPETCYLPC